MRNMHTTRAKAVKARKASLLNSFQMYYMLKVVPELTRTRLSLWYENENNKKMNRKCIIFVTAERVNASMPLIQCVCGWIVLQSVPKSGFGKPNPSIYKHTMNVTPKICADHTLHTQADTQTTLPQTKNTKQSPLFCPESLVTLPVTSSTHVHLSLSIKKRSLRH